MTYDPFRPIPQTKPRPNEKLWDVWARHKLFSCELNYTPISRLMQRLGVSKMANGLLLVLYIRPSRSCLGDDRQSE
jgi:hypothetical protein